MHTLSTTLWKQNECSLGDFLKKCCSNPHSTKGSDKWGLLRIKFSNCLLGERS